MFIGHYAAAMAGSRLSAGPSLGTWIMAAQWLDLVWPVFLILGLEQMRVDPGNTAVTPLDFVHYPYTHSLLAVVLWAVGFAGVYRFVFHGSAANALWLGGAVFSHWVLDFITHRPDLPLYPGSDTYAGLGLWNSLTGTLAFEASLFGLAAWWLLRGTRWNNRARYGFWALLIVLTLFYLANLFGPTPEPGMEGAIGWMSLSLWLFVAWGYWIDRLNRN